MADPFEGWPDYRPPSSVTTTPGVAVGGSEPGKELSTDTQWGGWGNITSAKKSSNFMPAIGGETSQEYTDWPGLVSGDPSKRKEAWKGLAGQAFGGAITRGVPGVRQLPPLTPADKRLMKEHPNLETAGNIAGGVLSSLPTAGIMPRGGALIPSMGAQGGINASEMMLDELAQKGMNTTPGDLARSGGVGFLTGAAGPALGRTLTPYGQSPVRGPNAGTDLANLLDSLRPTRDASGRFTTARPAPPVTPELENEARQFHTAVTEAQERNAGMTERATARQQRLQDAIQHYQDNPTMRYATEFGLPALEFLHSSSLPKAAAIWGATHFAPRAYHAAMPHIIANQAVTPANQYLLNALTSGVGKETQ